MYKNQEKSLHLWYFCQVKFIILPMQTNSGMYNNKNFYNYEKE